MRRGYYWNIAPFCFWLCQLCGSIVLGKQKTGNSVKMSSEYKCTLGVSCTMSSVHFMDWMKIAQIYHTHANLDTLPGKASRVNETLDRTARLCQWIRKRCQCVSPGHWKLPLIFKFPSRLSGEALSQAHDETAAQSGVKRLWQGLVHGSIVLTSYINYMPVHARIQTHACVKSLTNTRTHRHTHPHVG